MTARTSQASPRQVRGGICRSFQIPQLFIELTPAEYCRGGLHICAEGMSSFAGRRARTPGQVDELLDRFGLAPIAEPSRLGLAGGVRKLVDVAMAVTRRPKLLLLDEPTSGVAVEEKFPPWT